MSVEPTTPEGRAELRDLLEIVVPGPWKIDEHDETEFDSIVSTAEDRPFGWVEVARSLSPESDLIVAAVNALPALLDALDEQTQQAVDLRLKVEELRVRADESECEVESLRGDLLIERRQVSALEAILDRVRKLVDGVW